MLYPAIIHPEDGAYWVEFPDLPGCLVQSETLEETILSASSVLGAFLCSMMDRNIPIPPASEIKLLCVEDAEAFTSMIAADPYAFKTRTKAIKKTLTIPEWLNDAAEARHVNFSRVLQDALKAELQLP